MIEKKMPSREEIENTVMDMPRLDYLMAKYYSLYRIADTRTWIKFPPQTGISDHLQDNVMMVMNLEYMWSDYVTRWQIQQGVENEERFMETMETVMACIGTKSYIRTTVYSTYAAADISNSMFEQKRLEEAKEWQLLGLKMCKDAKQEPETTEEKGVPEAG